MAACTRCRSYAINYHLHGRDWDSTDADLCDVCYWRKRAEVAAVSDGWVLMPRVLTEEMLQAGYPADDAQEGYEAMIAARPEVP